MAKHLVQDTSLTAIADAIRAKTGGTEPLMFPSGMTEAIAGITGGEDLDAELAAQDELIDQIVAAIENKSAGGGGGGVFALSDFRAACVTGIYGGTYTTSIMPTS